MKEISGNCSLVFERPFVPFPVHKLFIVDDIDVTFNRGRIPVVTWNSSVHLQKWSGNSGFAVFCPKFVTSKGWKYLKDQYKNGDAKISWNGPSLPFSPLVSIFTDGAPEDAEWGHGSFPLDEYVKALGRSEEDPYYNHSLGMSYSKVWFDLIHISYFDCHCILLNSLEFPSF